MTKYKYIVFLTGVLLLGIHSAIIYFSSATFQITDVVKLHLFFTGLSYMVISACVKVKAIDSAKVGFTFLAGVTVKLIAGALYYHFMLPADKTVVLQFVLFYLLYLFVETYLAVKIIAQSNN